MLGYPRLSQEPSSLLADPRKKYPALTYLATAIGYITACYIKLNPLGSSDHNAKSNRDVAQNDVNDVDNKLKHLENKIQESNKRVIDLDCAIKNYDLFDQKISRFLMAFNGSTLPVLEKLNQFLKMQFLVDKTTTEKTTKKLSYVEEVEKCKYKYDCWGQAICGQKIDCCNQYVCHTDDVTYYYDEDTFITHYYSNILQGGPLKLEPLNCGYYSRNFTVNSPTTIKTYESLPSQHGSKESGEIDI